MYEQSKVGAGSRESFHRKISAGLWKIEDAIAKLDGLIQEVSGEIVAEGSANVKTTSLPAPSLKCVLELTGDTLQKNSERIMEQVNELHALLF